MFSEACRVVPICLPVHKILLISKQVFPRELKRAATQCDDKLTGLMQVTNIVATRTSKPTAWQLHLVPFISHISVLVRWFQPSWNLDLAATEFGWERGRSLYRVGLASKSGD
jgi:hypothetical protein